MSMGSIQIAEYGVRSHVTAAVQFTYYNRQTTGLFYVHSYGAVYASANVVSAKYPVVAATADGENYITVHIGHLGSAVEFTDTLYAVHINFGGA